MNRHILLPLVLLLISVSGWAQTPATPDDKPFIEKWATQETLEQVRKGGFVIYLRHGFTDNSRPDQAKPDLNDCTTQRVLSDAGRKLMRELGDSIRKAKIPVGDINVSPMCRAKESAELTFNKPYVVNEALMYWTTMSPAEKSPRLDALKKLLSMPVPRGTNRIVLAHAPNLRDLIGFFVKPEGTMVIFSQTGKEGYEYVASIHPAMWNGLIDGQ